MAAGRTATFKLRAIRPTKNSVAFSGHWLLKLEPGVKRRR
jgi:hypothetical protein